MKRKYEVVVLDSSSSSSSSSLSESVSGKMVEQSDRDGSRSDEEGGAQVSEGAGGRAVSAVKVEGEGERSGGEAVGGNMQWLRAVRMADVLRPRIVGGDRTDNWEVESPVECMAAIHLLVSRVEGLNFPNLDEEGVDVVTPWIPTLLQQRLIMRYEGPHSDPAPRPVSFCQWVQKPILVAGIDLAVEGCPVKTFRIDRIRALGGLRVPESLLRVEGSGLVSRRASTSPTTSGGALGGQHAAGPLVLCGSNLSGRQVRLARETVERLGGAEWADEWSDRVTVLVMPAVAAQLESTQASALVAPARTFKYLAALVSPATAVVAADWLDRCATRGTWLPPGDWQLVGDAVSLSTRPGEQKVADESRRQRRRSSIVGNDVAGSERRDVRAGCVTLAGLRHLHRDSRHRKFRRRRLLTGYRVCLWGELTPPASFSRARWTALLQAAGATVINEDDLLTQQAGSQSLVLVDEAYVNTATGDRALRETRRHLLASAVPGATATFVSTRWLVASIVTQQPEPFPGYTLAIVCPPNPTQLLASQPNDDEAISTSGDEQWSEGM